MNQYRKERNSTLNALPKRLLLHGLTKYFPNSSWNAILNKNSKKQSMFADVKQFLIMPKNAGQNSLQHCPKTTQMMPLSTVSALF